MFESARHSVTGTRNAIARTLLHPGLASTGGGNSISIRSRAHADPSTAHASERDWRPQIAGLATAVITASLVLAPSAAADSGDAIRSAVISARGATSCGPLKSDPVVQEVSDIANRSTDTYLDHDAQTAPISNPLPGIPGLSPLQVLNDRGSGAKKAKLLQGAGRNEADAIKFILISGYNSIPDCSYTQYGVSLTQNTTSGYFLTSMVLAGV